MERPLLVFDTNVLMDILLGRDGAVAVGLVKLAEAGIVDLIVPDYVLLEFRGTALRWIRSEIKRLDDLRKVVNDWGWLQELDQPAAQIKAAASEAAKKLKDLPAEIQAVVARIRGVAMVTAHTPEVHFRGDLRYLSGHPPDRPVDGLNDCRIYEAVLDIARSNQGDVRPKFLVTKDSDFDMLDLVSELEGLGFKLRSDPGRLYGELKR